MLTVYLVCLLTGGLFVAGSALFGGHGHGDSDHDIGSEIDHGGPDLLHDSGSSGALLLHDGSAPDSELDSGSDAGGQLLLPFLSLRFWTFFLAFFGLTGTVLTGLGLWASQALIVPAAVGMGLLSGYGVSYAFGRLRNQVVDSSLQDRDYLGATGRVLLPIARGQTGKVRLELRGRTLDLLAETDDEQPLGLRQDVFVYGIERGVLKVTDPNLRRLSAPESLS